jgi:hypothetical protein
LNKAKQNSKDRRGYGLVDSPKNRQRAPANSSIFARIADVLVHCCYMVSAEIENDPADDRSELTTLEIRMPDQRKISVLPKLMRQAKRSRQLG